MDMITRYAESVRRKKTKRLRNYYNENGLTLIGINDSQEIFDQTVFRKGLLDYLAKMLKDEKTSATIINAFSPIFNRTDHIDYFLKSNLSIKEIKNIQLASMLVMFEEKIKELHLPKFVGKVGNINKRLYRQEENDDKLHLSDIIRQSKEPIVIYSCGLSDLILESDSDFCGEKIVVKEDSVIKVIDGVENNINNILSLNNKTDIYVLGVQSKKNRILRDKILEYNRRLSDLCDKYDLQYVDTGAIYQEQTRELATYKLVTIIIENMYNRKFWKKNTPKSINNNFTVDGNGLSDLLVYLYQNTVEQEESQMNEQKKSRVQEEFKIVEKVLLKRM